MFQKICNLKVYPSISYVSFGEFKNQCQSKRHYRPSFIAPHSVKHSCGLLKVIAIDTAHAFPFFPPLPLLPSFFFFPNEPSINGKIVSIDLASQPACVLARTAVHCFASSAAPPLRGLLLCTGGNCIGQYFGPLVLMYILVNCLQLTLAACCEYDKT